ncbi:hypothetical protein BKA65DRAFT_302945 [Rhexocercosporidium sp. MPI-PUGE-AT-0058]|nr:hypothetical protein BKA65DRAFT_302945 [Rhexocercosporidium sp. MPI-PUGE-AT-0058]
MKPANSRKNSGDAAYNPKQHHTAVQSSPYFGCSAESVNSNMNDGKTDGCSGNLDGFSDALDDCQPLPFVIIEEPLRPASKEHRKTVRHHVMRAVHSRRRAQNKSTVRKHTLIQKDSAAVPVSDSDLAVPEASAEDVLPSPTSPLDPHTAVDRVKVLTKSSNIVAHSSNQNKQLINANHKDASYPPGQSSKAQGGTLEDSQFFSIAGFVRPFDQWTFDTSTPYALFQLDGAPILCMRPEGWPFPEQVGKLTPKVSVWMPSRIIPIPNFRSPRDSLHKSAQVLPYIHNSQEYFAFKVETIKWINSRLPHDVLGTSDTTIGSILLLISFEIARGNTAESIHHVNGLERIVNLRGGIDSFGNNKHFLIKVLLLDLIVSIMSNTSPRFNQTTATTSLPSNILGIRLNRISDSPLYSSRRLEYILRGSPFCKKSIQTLQHMQDLTNGQQSRTLTYTLPPLTATANKPITLLHRIILLTATIFESATQTPPTPFSSPINLPIAQELCQALESPINDATWDAFPGIFVWILLTGAAASPDTSAEHSYFVSLLMKVGLGAGYGWFEELSKAMGAFTRIKRRAEGLVSDAEFAL